MQIETIRFGQVEIDEEKLLTFPEGLPGLEEYKTFAVLQFDESYPIIWLQAVDEGKICLPVIDTFSVLPDYAFNLGDEDVKLLEIQRPEDIHVISVLVITDNIEQMTMNLAAPIVINLVTRQARQVILGGSDYNVRFPIFQGICRLIKEGEASAGAIKEDQ